jgi:signal transduction histidine kinase
MIATAIIMAVVFGAVYFVVQETVMRNLDNDLAYEAGKHQDEIEITGDTIFFINRTEWEEKEHQEIQVNPVFIQLVGKQGRTMDKSPNLKSDSLPFYESDFGGHFNARLHNGAIREVQLPIEKDGEIKGYILAAMSSESALAVVRNLRNVLALSYLVVLIGLYFISRFLAGRSIKPVQNVTNTISQISKLYLKDRVELPPNKDEIYELATSFNDLLERIENAIEREKQFTSDASHELRTPLASLRGTLEVLIRKERSPEEYEEKIEFCLQEIDRMTIVLEQLLLLARLDTKANVENNLLVPLPAIIDKSLTHLKKQIVEKELRISLVVEQDKEFLTPSYYTTAILQNILSNAVKYSHKGGTITVKVDQVDQNIVCVVQDEGVGIEANDLAHIFENFFRSDSLKHKHISGNGLGLSIVRKCAEAINAKLDVKSMLGQGTTVTIAF